MLLVMLQVPPVSEFGTGPLTGCNSATLAVWVVIYIFLLPWRPLLLHENLQVNTSNIKMIAPELFQLNLVRGRGLFARSVMKAQLASPGFTPVFAALVAVINTKLPENGELILKRVIVAFRRAYKRRDKVVATALAKFIAHLVNQQVGSRAVGAEGDTPAWVHLSSVQGLLLLGWLPAMMVARGLEERRDAIRTVAFRSCPCCLASHVETLSVFILSPTSSLIGIHLRVSKEGRNQPFLQGTSGPASAKGCSCNAPAGLKPQGRVPSVGDDCMM